MRIEKYRGSKMTYKLELLRVMVNFLVAKYPAISEASISKELGYSRNYLNTTLKNGLKSEEKLLELIEDVYLEFNYEDEREFIAHLNSRLCHSENVLQTVRYNNDELRKTIKELNVANSESQKEELQKQVERLTDDLKIARASFDISQGNLAECQKQKKELESKVAEKNTRLEFLVDDKAVLRGNVAKARLENDQLHGKLNKLKICLAWFILFSIAMVFASVFLWNFG